MKKNTRNTRGPGAWVLGGVASLLIGMSANGQYSVTQPAAITINDYAVATPYPCSIYLTNGNLVGVIETVTVTVNNLTHPYAPDIGLLLVGPNGQGVILMSGSGGNPAGSAALDKATITFSDSAAASLPVASPLVSGGSYKPTDNANLSFPSPAASTGYATTLSGAFGGANPNGVWSLYVLDDSPGPPTSVTPSIGSWTLNLFTTPVLSLATNTVYLAENDQAVTVNFSVQDSSPPAGGFTATAGNSATNIVSATATVSGTTGMLTLTPLQNSFGTNTITLTVSDGISSVSGNVTVNLAHVNQAPTLAITNSSVSTVAGLVSPVVNVTVNDVDPGDQATSLTLSVVSSDTNVVAPSGVFFSTADTGPLRKFSVVPKGTNAGSATLTFTVTDSGGLSNSASILVNVTPATHPAYANTTVLGLAAAGTTNSSIAVSNVPGLIGNVTVSVNGLSGVAGNNLGLALVAPGGAVTLLNNSGGAGTFAQATFASSGAASLPSSDSISGVTLQAAGLSSLVGTSPIGIWTLWATNGGAAAQITGGWVLNIYAAPTIASTVTNISMPEETSTNITFTVSGVNGTITNASNVTITSGNTDLIAVVNPAFDTTTGIGTAQLQAIFKTTGPQYGTTTVTVTAQDNNNFTATYVYQVTVTFVNHAPQITYIPRQITRVGQVLGPVPFGVSDPDLPPQTLTVTATSDNQTLLPDSNILLEGSGANMTYTCFPLGASSGMANMTLTVSDGITTSSTMFSVYVQSQGNPLFASQKPISIPANAPADTYPSMIGVNNLVGTISQVRVSLFDITHSAPADLNVLLVSPQGTKVLLMGHAGGANALANTTLVFADSASTSLPDAAQIISGTYKPTSYGAAATFPAPAPAGPYATALGAFNGLNGTNANGLWALYMVDSGTGKGVMVSGWQLSIQTAVSVQPIADVAMRENDKTLQIPVSVGDDQPGVNINVSATPADPTVVQTLFEAGSGGTRTLDVTPVPYHTGSNILVTVTATSGTQSSSSTFHVTVYQVNLPPVVTAPANISTPAASPSPVTTFTAWDPQDSPLSVTALSSDTKLIPNGNITVSSGTVIGQTNSHNIYQFGVSVQPAGIGTGPAIITLTVGDAAGQSASTSFNVTVTPALVFQNSDGPIAIPVGYPIASNATPFPSVITVTNVHGAVTGAHVTLLGFSHQYPQDVDVLLVSPDNSKSIILMAHAGGSTSVNNVDLSFADAAQSLPFGSALSKGTYAPSSYASGLTFGGGAPTSGYTTNLSSLVGVSPNGNWKLYVMDDSYPLSGNINGWLLSLQTGPAFDLTTLGPKTTPENTMAVIPFNVLDDSMDPSALAVTASTNGAVMPTNVLNLIGSLQVTNNAGGARTLIVAPLPNLPSSITNVDATATIVLTVTDTNNASASTTFPLTVSFGNQPPVITTPSNTLWTVENQPVMAVYTLSDVDSTLFLSNLVVRFADPALIPNDTNHIAVTVSTNRIAQGGTGTVTVQLTPAAYTPGTNTLTVSISDGTTTTANNATVNVGFVAHGPIITGLPSTYNSPAGSATAPIPFTVASPEGVPATSLTVTAISQNQGIVPNANIILGGSADTRTIQLIPLGTVGGADTITLKVGDGSKTNSFQFVANFTAPPVTLFGNGQVVNVVGTTNAVNSSLYPITFDVTNLIGSIYDVSLEMRGFSNSAPAKFDALLVSPDGIAVMLMSGAGGTIPVSGLDLVFDDSGATMQGGGPLTNGTYHPAYYTKRLLPAPAPQNSYQTRLSAFAASTSVNGTWQLFVNDLTTPGDFAQIAGGFYLTVVTKPTIQVTSTLPVTVRENGSTVVNFTVNDATTATTNLAVSAASDNSTLLPAVAPNVVITALAPGTNNNFSATVTPVRYVNGAVNLSLIATRADGASMTAAVPITVTATNFPPVISRLLSQSIAENSSVTVEFLVSDVDTPLKSLTVQAVSDTQGVVANSNLTFLGYATNFVSGLPASGVPQVSDLQLTISPNSFAVGTATISIIVTDSTTNGVNVVSSNFLVTVSPVIYPPTLSALPDQTLTAGSNIVIGFSVTSQNQGSPTLAVTATSSDPTLVRNPKLIVSPASATGVANRTLQITAEQNAKGSATITLTATDTSNGNVSTQRTFELTVLPTPIHTFASTQQITIPDVGTASPYPSQLAVSGLMGTISRATVTLNGFGHTYPNDVGVLMVSPAGQKIVLMDRAGGGTPVTNLTLTFDASTANPIPQGSALTNGTYKPADYNASTYDYPTPAPAHPYSTDLTTLNGTVPNGTWSLYVVDQSPPDHGAISNGWSLTFTTQPSINGLQNMVINENANGTQPFSVGDDSPSGPSFRFGVSSTNATLIPNSGVTFSGSGTNFQMTVAPALNRFGTNYVTVYVTNIDNMVASSSFLVTVPQVIQPPFIAPIADSNVAAGGIASIPVTYGDIQVAQNQLQVAFQSSDLNLVPLKNISLSGNVLQIIPAGAPATTATATITMTVTQSAPYNLSTNTSFKLTVIPTPNLFGNSAGILINDRAPATPYPSTITVSNVAGNIVKATVSVRGLAHTYPSDISMLLVGPQGQKVVLMSRAGSGVGSAITNVNLVFDDSAASSPVQSGVITNGTYKPSDYNGSLAFYAPAPAGQYVTNLSAFNGTSANGTWSLWVQDDLSPDSGVINGDWLISFVTTAPLISAIGPQTTAENHPLTLNFSVSSALVSGSNLTVTASSSAQVPPGIISSLNVLGSGTNAATSRQLVIVPGLNLPSAATNIDGTAMITLLMTDGTNSSSASFPLTVTFADQPPTLAGLSNATTAANAPLAIHFTANDVDTPASSLSVNAVSSVPSLGTLALTSSGNAQTLNFTPNGTTGSTVVTVTVSDGQLSATNTLTITVTPAIPPVLGAIADTNTTANVPLAIALNVSSAATAITNLTYTGAGTNAALVRNVTFAYNGTTEVATVNLVTNKIGVDYITITVSDGLTNASQSFALEVQAPEPVEFGPIANQTTTANAPVTVTLNITSPVVPISALTFAGTSSNPALVSGVAFSNDGVKVAATVNLVHNQVGTAVVTIAVNDGFNTVSNSYNLTVTNAPVGPTLALSVQNGQLHLSFVGTANANYGILSSTDLKSWTDTGLTVTAHASGTASTSIPLPGSAGGKFYRVVVK